MNILLILHYIIILFVVAIPFMPYKVLKYLYFIPLIIPTLWVLTGDCPISKSHRTTKDEDSFTRNIYKKFNKNITEQDTSHLNTFLLVLIMFLIATRFRLGY